MRFLPSCSFLATHHSTAQVPAFRDLFNGKDLTGWVNVNTDTDTWSVSDGILVCKGKPIGVMRSDKQYENFMLHIEWKHTSQAEIPVCSSGATPSQAKRTASQRR